jgi:hypothetical protein
MPEKIVGPSTTEWRCTGHVVRVERIDTSGELGVGVQFDCYEVSRSKQVEAAVGEAMPQRMTPYTCSRTSRKDIDGWGIT